MSKTNWVRVSSLLMGALAIVFLALSGCGGGSTTSSGPNSNWGALVWGGDTWDGP